MRDLRSLIDDTEVTLSFYGSIVYLAVVSALGARAAPPPPTVAISTVVATAIVLYIAHVFAALVPKAARAGRLHAADLGAALSHDVPLLICAIVPTLPLMLAAWGGVEIETGYRLSVRLTLVLLFILAVTLSRRDGLPWKRAIGASLVITGIAILVTWLEALIH